MKSMKRARSEAPDLNDCIRSLENLTKDLLSTRSPKTVGEIYVSALGLLYHLKLDQKKILSKQNEGNENIPFPEIREIPAMEAVIHNQNLFRALISCLSSTTLQAADVDPISATTPSTLPRKRAHSFGNETEFANKIFKASHSPHVGIKRVSAIVGRTTANNTTSNSATPKLNVKILAATILFTSFEYLDHWPVPLVQAYAEDCFGPRSWVDEPACQMLVDNLALTHRKENVESSLFSQEGDEEGFSSDAGLVADFYFNFGGQRIETNGKLSPPVVPSFKQARRGSHSSHASQASSSLSFPSSSGMSQRPRALSSESFEFSTQHTKITTVTSNDTNDADESDSGDDEEVAVSTSFSKESSFHDNNDGGASSSSGEEDEEEIILATRSYDDDESSHRSSTPVPPPIRNDILKHTYPVTQRETKYKRIRQRYFGLNLQHAHSAIALSLKNRLDVKSKQNSGLLQALPHFTSLPQVRSLITANLEKWLQSPALAGLARSLFSTTVSMMKKVDPPLPEDLAAIDNILSMRLKANQLNAHVENITAIANNIPTAAVSEHIYESLLRQILLTMDLDLANETGSDQLKMIHAVYNVLPTSLSAEGIASAFLTLLFHHPELLDTMNLPQLVKGLRLLMRKIAKELGVAFDAYQVLSSMISRRVQKEQWTVEDEENKARLLYQCTTLAAQQDEQKLIQCRRILLKWCCRDYAPLWAKHQKPVIKKGAEKKKKGEEIIGAGPADYSSLLDGLNDTIFPPWLDVMRCVLFLEDASSPRLITFLSPDKSALDNESEWNEEVKRITFCCENGGDVDDDMIWTILKGAALKKGAVPPKMALPLVEHLFESCKKGGNASLRIKDPNILWELYKLVEYIPAKVLSQKRDDGQGDVPMSDTNSHPDKTSSESNANNEQIPKLAFPGMWWRVTGLALIICGTAPNEVGSTVWQEHPTLRALMKMVTSDRYRFPTVDCDPTARDHMLKTEQAMRGEEAKITEILFSPKKPVKKKKKEVLAEAPRGSRISKRQQEKREKQLQKQREKEAAQAAAEANRRKKMLRAAQKSIMLWDPRKGARKPPKESVDLILSVGDLFELPGFFQQCTKPDFLMMTIGNTTRGAIERAYDWLIPIISVTPSTIARLPASASCFLLLRAYGTEGEERTQLQKLSAPLLLHVRDSMMGRFGKSDAVRAFDLLFTDVASSNADRRRCARRVLHDAIGKEETLNGEDNSVFQETNYAWMIKMLGVEHVNSFLSDVIKYVYRAASFERGRTLRFHILGLERLNAFAQNNDIPGNCNFPSMFIELISKRPTVFAASMGSFPDLRSLAIRIVHNEFSSYMKQSSSREGEMDKQSAVEISLFCGTLSNSDRETMKVTLPLSLLQSACVLLSIWLEADKGAPEDVAVKDLVKMLMRPHETDGVDTVDGLASARIAGSGESVVPVELWVMLARSRSDFIAKRAALTAPTGFLPRLLLCSGLPRASLLTMIDRLGKVGDKATDKEKKFNQLLVSSAASEWDIGRVGHRREVTRKLLGRLSAYSDMYKLAKLQDDQQISFTFLDWLSHSCKASAKQQRQTVRKQKSPSSTTLNSLDSVKSILGSLPELIDTSVQHDEMSLEGNSSDMTVFRAFGSDDAASFPKALDDSEEVKEFIDLNFKRDEVHHLDKWLEENFGQIQMEPKSRKRKHETNLYQKMQSDELSFLLLNAFISLERKTESSGCCVLKWVPKLSMAKGSKKLWKLLFMDGQKPPSMWKNLISRCEQCWSYSHVSQCRTWILSEGKNEDLDVRNTVRFLVLSSGMSTIHVERFSDVVVAQEDNAWARSEDSVLSACKLALACVCQPDDDALGQRLQSRNSPPDFLILLLLIARLGKKQVQCVSQAVIKQLEAKDDKFRPMFLAILLRIYAYFPQLMNLGDATLRSHLKSAVETHANVWSCWRSPMDDIYQDLIDSLISNGSPHRVVQALSEVAKKHPLLLLRRLPALQQALEMDAIACEQNETNEKQGTLFGTNPNGLLTAKVDGELIKLKVTHWGFNFTESLWVSFLEIISALPKEVLFGCGLKMGIHDFLGVYLRLMFVQTQLLTNERFVRFKGKFAEFLNSFSSCNKSGWDEWLNLEVDELSSLGVTRNLLMSCDFISHQQAIDSVKQKYQ